MRASAAGRRVGDPGFLSFLGKVAKKAVGSIPVVGGALEAGLDLIGGGNDSRAVAVSRAAATPRTITSAAQVPGIGIAGLATGLLTRVAPRPGAGDVTINPPFLGSPGAGITVSGGAPALPRFGGSPAANGARPMMQAGKCPSGWHPNKSSYFLKDGTYVPAGSRCVRNRSRDPLNPRALRRAIGRIDAGKKWQAKLAEIETGKHTKSGRRKD